MSWAVRPEARWVPRDLLRLTPLDRGWLTDNGRASLRLRGPGIVRADYDPHSTQVLTRGTWTLDWDLDEPLLVRVRVLDRLDARTAALPVAPAEVFVQPVAGTAWAARRDALTPTQRQRMAVLFQHLLDETRAPENLCASAAAALGMTEAQVRRFAYKVRDRINEQRPLQQLTTLEELGQYLVRTTRAITQRDLPGQQRQGDPRPL